MEKGYVENGFIVDLAHSKKTSEVIYELSKILDMPEAKHKKICLKLGSMNLSESELVSIKALIETMDSEIEFISTSSDVTSAAAGEVGIQISQLNTVVPALDINASQEINNSVSEELTTALDRIFGDVSFDVEPENQESENNSTVQKIVDKISDENVVESDIQIVSFEEPEDLEELRKHDRETENLPTLYIHRTRVL